MAAEYEKVSTKGGVDTDAGGSSVAPVNAHTKKGDMLMQRAEKELAKAGGFFSRMFSASRYDDIGEIYKQAGNAYKLGKAWSKAGEAFVAGSEAFVKGECGYDAASCLVNAANMYKKVSIESAVHCYQRAISFYTDGGRFTMAAKYQMEIALMYENDMALDEAIQAYQLAGEYYEGEGSQTSANKAFLKVAEFAAQLERYARAIEIYERVAASALQNNLTKWGVKDYFFRAILCYMVQGDQVATKHALERYQEMDFTFASQRECKFLKQIISAQELQDVAAFTNAVVEYDSITKFSPWHTSLLLKIKQAIREPEPDFL